MSTTFPETATKLDITYGKIYLQYFWVDTCCIDKSNHAELSRKIDALFRRYSWELLYRKLGLVVCGNIARC